MKLVFGRNRRQLPLELLTPGGRIVISREPYGTILVKLVADAGAVVVDPKSRDYCGLVRLTHEAEEQEQ